MENGKKRSSGRVIGTGSDDRKSEQENALEAAIAPLREAARRIADMLCEFSGEQELFVCGGSPERKLDTKALKEFSSVLKEISAVVAELNGDEAQRTGDIHIEFSEDALNMSS